MRPVLRLALGVALATALATSVSAQVVVNDVPLTAEEGWVEEGTSYITLRGLHRVMEDSTLHWEESTRTATLTGEGFQLWMGLGAHYVEVNDRAIHCPDGVGAPNGHTALPLRLLADALDGHVEWDGTTGTAYLWTGKLDGDSVSYDEVDLLWLSRIISAESRGESLDGQIAVGNVVLNRVVCDRYPDNIYGVIFDTNYGVQFEPVMNGTVYSDPAPSSVVAAKLALEGTDVVGEALYFFAPALSPGTWIRNNTTYLTTIGCHEFYID